VTPRVAAYAPMAFLKVMSWAAKASSLALR
jgi:hypothetical protein